MNRNDQTLLGKFYKDLDQMMDLKLGRVLLAISSQSQLETMLAKDLPFVTEYAEEIHLCSSEKNCTGLTALVNTIGEFS